MHHMVAGLDVGEEKLRGDGAVARRATARPRLAPAEKLRVGEEVQVKAGGFVLQPAHDEALADHALDERDAARRRRAPQFALHMGDDAGFLSVSCSRAAWRGRGRGRRRRGAPWRRRRRSA